MGDWIGVTQNSLISGGISRDSQWNHNFIWEQVNGSPIAVPYLKKTCGFFGLDNWKVLGSDFSGPNNLCFLGVKNRTVRLYPSGNCLCLLRLRSTAKPKPLAELTMGMTKRWLWWSKIMDGDYGESHTTYHVVPGSSVPGFLGAHRNHIIDEAIV